MKHPSGMNVIAKDDIDAAAAAQCATLLATLDDSTTVQLQSADAGVWNNVVLQATTPKQTYYYKQYRVFKNVPNYAPPAIPPEQRALVARLAQAAATAYPDDQPLAPAVLAYDSTALIMAAVPQATALFAYLSQGGCPRSVTTMLPQLLARFHSRNAGEAFMTTALSDNRFRDYKIDLQYNRVAAALAPAKGRRLRAFARWYKQQCQCLVHGDLNSKNILMDMQGRVHVIDFEQAHLGTPAYDVAFLVSELVIAEAQYPNLGGIARTFTEQYLAGLDGIDQSAVAHEATLHLAAQIIYRFEGPSHKVWTSHISEAVRTSVLSKAADLISADPPHILSVL